jgi:hypothetical protein
MQSFTPMLTNCAPAGWQVKMGLMVPMRDFSLISQAMMISSFSLVRSGPFRHVCQSKAAALENTAGEPRRGCTPSSAESVPTPSARSGFPAPPPPPRTACPRRYGVFRLPRALSRVCLFPFRRPSKLRAALMF